jgi:two-component system sensor histidine kinase DesK
VTADAEPTESAPLRPVGRFGPWLALLWLFFLWQPLSDAWQARDTTAGVVGLLATVVFAAVYMSVWLRFRASRARLLIEPPLREAVLVLAVLLALAVVMTGTLGEEGATSIVYLGVTGIIVLRNPAAIPFVIVVGGLAQAIGDLWLGWDNTFSLVLSTCAAALGVFGMKSMVRRNLELIRAHQENARLAVANERNRFSRDLHDILGHSLTVITVKAQLANRLVELDPERARSELADLERLSREALADVRRAVEGYRELSLSGEVAHARQALAAAGIAADLPTTVGEVPAELHELFAWGVREGVTNVVRHSGADRCAVRVTPVRLEVRDNGHGAAREAAQGNGLRGLRERAAAMGARVVTESRDDGFLLAVDA